MTLRRSGCEATIPNGNAVATVHEALGYRMSVDLDHVPAGGRYRVNSTAAAAK